MNNFKKMLAVSGNSVASTGGAWGYLFPNYSGLGLVNPRMTFDNDNESIIFFGGYNQGAASIKKDGSSVNWNKSFSGPNLTHSTRGTDSPSWRTIDSYQRPLILSSTKTLFYQGGTWLWTNPYLFLYFPVFRVINTGTGDITSTRVIPQETSYDTATATIGIQHYGMCCDSSGNYILSFESGNYAYMEGYNSSDVLQWTKRTSSTLDGAIPLVRNIGTDTEVPCIEHRENRFIKVNITTGAISNYNGKKLSGYNPSQSYNRDIEQLGYDSSGNISYISENVDETDANTTPTGQQVWIRMSSTGTVVSAYGIAYLPNNQKIFRASMDSSDNLYYLHYDGGESTQTTSEYGPKIIKIASDGTVVWERVITSDYTGTSTCTIYDIAVSDDDELFYVTCRIRHSSPFGYDYAVFALPTDGTATTYTAGSKTYNFKALADGNSRFAVTSYSYTVSNDTGTATWSTATSPGTYTSGLGSSSDTDLTDSYTEFTVS